MKISPGTAKFIPFAQLYFCGILSGMTIVFHRKEYHVQRMMGIYTQLGPLLIYFAVG